MKGKENDRQRMGSAPTATRRRSAAEERHRSTMGILSDTDELCNVSVSVACSMSDLARVRQTARMARLATDAYQLACAAHGFFAAVLQELTEAEGQVVS